MHKDKKLKQYVLEQKKVYRNVQLKNYKFSTLLTVFNIKCSVSFNVNTFSI